MSAVSVIVPTLGRPSLKGTLRSLAPQLADGDEVIVVADPAGDVENSRRIFNGWARDERWQFHELPKAGNDMGYSGRNLAMSLATTPKLTFCDDDDQYTPNALDAIRGSSLEVPTLFRMSYFHGGATLWQSQNIHFGNVGTPMFAIPNLSGKLGTWAGWEGTSSGGDCHFITTTVQRMGQPQWNEFVVCLIKPS